MSIKLETALIQASKWIANCRCRQTEVIGDVRIVLPYVQNAPKKPLQIFIANDALTLSCLPLIKF